MRSPIILDNRSDLLVFGTTEEALAYAEAVDVEANEYEAFDSEGRRLTLGTGPGGRYGTKRVLIAKVEETPDHHDELRRRIVRFLSRVGITPDPNASLDALITELSAMQRSS